MSLEIQSVTLVLIYLSYILYLVGGDGELAEVLDIGPEEGVLPDPEVALAAGVEQVPHPLAVDLHVAHLDRHAGRLPFSHLSSDSDLFTVVK